MAVWQHYPQTILDSRLDSIWIPPLDVGSVLVLLARLSGTRTPPTVVSVFHNNNGKQAE